jgi:threonine synthase
MLPGNVQLVAAQPAACAPLVAALDADANEVTPVTPGTTRAEGTRIAAPARSSQLLEAVRGSAGWAAAVSEDEIADAARELWAQGVYVEPTAAVGAAACRRAISDGSLPVDATPVVLITGNGLKATGTIDEMLAEQQAST